ncbi:MAG: nitroreductase [Bdellovibrionales bacterium]
MEVITGKDDPNVLDYLLRRRSAKIDHLSGSGPSAAQIESILTAALRVPDHGKMCPWYCLVFEGDARRDVGDILADAYIKDHPDAREDKIEAERHRFMRAPVVIALVSRVRKGKKPIWEQILSAGAAGQNLSLAAHALGFGVQWVSEWYAYHEGVKAQLGMDHRDHVVGFFYIGKASEVQADRDRPDLEQVVTYWRRRVPLAKGDCYDVEKLGFPDAGFDLLKIYD